MPYGLDRQPSGHDLSAVRASNACIIRGRSWRMMEPDRRLQVIEKALQTPSYNFGDGFPAAL